MDVKQAVQTAARYVADLESMAGDESSSLPKEQVLKDIRFAVEGTHFDDRANRWNIDVGFARKWDQAGSSPLAGLAAAPLKDNRTYKTVSIDNESGEVVSYGGK